MIVPHRDECSDLALGPGPPAVNLWLSGEQQAHVVLVVDDIQNLAVAGLDLHAIAGDEPRCDALRLFGRLQGRDMVGCDRCNDCTLGSFVASSASAVAVSGPEEERILRYSRGRCELQTCPSFPRQTTHSAAGDSAPDGEMDRVGWTPQAADDLEATCLFIARDTPQIAAAFAERVVTATDRLENHPAWEEWSRSSVSRTCERFW